MRRSPGKIPLHRSVAARVSLFYALVGAVWVYASDALLARWIDYPPSATLLQTYKGWLFVAVTAVLLYGLISSALARIYSEPFGADAGGLSRAAPILSAPSLWRDARTPLLIFFLLAGAIAAIGYLLYEHQKNTLLREEKAELLVIANDKVAEISHWLAERRNDAQALADNPFIASAAARWLGAGAPDDDEGKRLAAWLASLGEGSLDYSAALLIDANGRLRLGIGADKIHPRRQALVAQALQSRRVVLSDLHWRQEIVGGPIDLDLIAPLAGGPTAAQRPVGALLLKIDPSRYLFPLIQTWPAPSPSAETLLVRREGDELVYLNELRHRKNTALMFRLPMSSERLPAALAVQGREGIVEGIDYRRVEVLAAVRAVPDTGWFLVAKVDADEVYAPTRSVMLLVASVAGVLIIGAGVGTSLWWRQQHARFLAEGYRRELERRALAQHYDYLVKYANDIILLMDVEGQILEANARAVSAYGYSHEELLRLNIRDLRDPASRGLVTGQMTQAATAEGLRFETVHRRRDGGLFAVEVSARLIEVEGRQYLQSIIRDITERKHYEQKLEAAERFARATLDALSAHLGVLDETGIILRVNQAWRDFARANAIDPAQVSEGKKYLEVCAGAGGPDGDEALSFAEGIRAVLAGERREFSLEYPCHSPTERRWFLGKVTPFHTLAPGRVVVAHENISGRKRAEETLAEQRDLLETILNQAADAIVVCDRRQTLTLVNAAARRLALLDPLGKSLDMRPSAWGKAHYPDGRPVPPREWSLARALAGETSVGQEARMVRPDGSYYDVLISAAPLRNARQEIIGAVAILADITQRKRMENALRESAARLRAIANAVPDVLLVMDEEGRYVEILTSQPQLLYTDPAALKGKRVGEVMRPGLAQRVLEVIRKTFLTRQPQMFEYELRIAQVGRRYFEARTAPIEASGLHKPAVVIMARDVTQRKITEDNLRQAQKMEAVGQLTGGIAHDFNNLLAVILGNLELLAEALERPDLKDLAQRSLETAERGAALVQRLLAFSRRQPLQARAVDLNALVAGMLDLLRRTLGAAVQVRTVLAEDLAQTVLDPAQLETALLNLALNARDAMPRGGTLTIETANRELDEDYAGVHQIRPGRYALLTVSDTGVGMPLEVLEHAFEPFFTTKEVGKGSGLGLSMVYGLVKQSGGHIKLYSELGRGTAVKIYLPHARPEAQSAIQAQTREAAPRPGRAELILVVEDDGHVRQLAVGMLQSLGYRTVEADNAATALQVLAQTPQVALLFTDVVLPGGSNGIELAAQARHRHPELKVLFTSGYTESSLAHYYPFQEGTDLLSKPYRKSDLAGKLHDILSAPPNPADPPVERAGQRAFRSDA